MTCMWIFVPKEKEEKDMHVNNANLLRVGLTLGTQDQRNLKEEQFLHQETFQTLDN